MATSKIKGKSQFVQKCIFCGGTGVTNQHVLPNWINREFPSATTYHPNTRTSFEGHSNGIPLYSGTFKKFQGSLGSKKIKNVCSKCNSEWMSQLENSVKSAMIKIIKNQTGTLTIGDQKLLASWIMLATIIFEYDQPDVRAATKADRDFLFEHKHPPESNWEMWIAKSADIHMSRRLFHRGGWGGSVDEFRSSLDKRAKSNYQVTVIGIEKAVFISRLSNWEFFNEKQLSHEYIKIWPMSTDEVILPLEVIETVDPEIFQILNVFESRDPIHRIGGFSDGYLE